MQQTFLIAFREALQCTFIVSILLLYHPIRDNKRYFRYLIAGVLTAFILGFSIGYIPSISRFASNNEVWTFWRYIAETWIFYLSIVFIVLESKPSESAVSAGLFILGFIIFFFEARATGFLMLDIGAMTNKIFETFAAGIIGIFAGLFPLFFAKRLVQKISFKNPLLFASLIMTIGTWKFISGGVGELEKGGILLILQKGFLDFLDNFTGHIQSVLLIPDHTFIKIPFSGLFHFLSGDRTAMTLVVVFLMCPPVFILSHLFARPDPVVNDIQIGAQRRLSISFFRKDLIYQSVPVLAAFFMLVFLIHAVNASVNTLYEPTPVPVKEIEGQNILRIPVSDKFGSLADKKLKKYVYFYGNSQVIIIAILRPDGSAGVALDECEICRPAEWNKDAQGYAQRGDHLVCKYCMTPIAVSTVNSPGGCNPIPLPYKIDNNNIVITLEDLIRIHKSVKALEKKGTHL